MTSFERAGRLVALLSVGAVVGCAAQPKAEMQPGTPGAVPASPTTTFAPEPEPQTLAEAEALLEKARGDLDRLALNPPAPSADGAAATATVPAPAPPSAPARAESRSESAQSEGAEPAPKAESQCQSACRAFSSLSRASDAVCRLEAGGGKRCERARQIRNDASQRVAGCGCLQ